MIWVDETIQFAGHTWMRKAENRELWKRMGEAFRAFQQWIDNGWK